MLTSLLLTALSPFLAAPTDAPPAELTIMSYNLRHGLGKDGEDVWENRKPRLRQMLERHRPAILGTQECLDFQAAFMLEVLPGFGQIALGREADATGEMTAIFYDRALLVPLESGHFWLSDSPDTPGSKSWDSSLPRIASWARFHHLPSGTSFYFYNTHFDHRGAGARLESAALLAKRFKERHADQTVVLMGDFNAPAGSSEPWTRLIEGGMVDLWDGAAERRGEADTWNGFEFPAPDEPKRIDWIMATPDVKALWCEIDGSHDNGRYPSDHMPVIARIQLPAVP